MSFNMKNRCLKDKILFFFERNKLMYLIFKRIIDFVLSFLGMLFLLPLFIFLAIAVKIDSKGPILFKQKRIGIRKIKF